MFLQHCVNVSFRRNAAIMTVSGNTEHDTPTRREFLTWLQTKLPDEYDNAWYNMLGGNPSTGQIRTGVRRVTNAKQQARELWEQQNGSVDAIPAILETVARDNRLKQYQIEWVSDDVFGS